MPLLVGLGNPGPQYQDTRHNIGFALLDKLQLSCEGFEGWKPWKNSLFCKFKLGSANVMGVKPQTFMNLSGEAIQPLLAFYKIPLSELVVIADDVELPIGSVRIRMQGGHGGHNGLRDIIRLLGENFIRIRIGVGPCPPGWDLADFVLGQFEPKDREYLKTVVNDFPKLVETGFSQGWEMAATIYNRRVDPSPR